MVKIKNSFLKHSSDENMWKDVERPPEDENTTGVSAELVHNGMM